MALGIGDSERDAEIGMFCQRKLGGLHGEQHRQDVPALMELHGGKHSGEEFCNLLLDRRVGRLRDIHPVALASRISQGGLRLLPFDIKRTVGPRTRE